MTITYKKYYDISLSGLLLILLFSTFNLIQFNLAFALNFGLISIRPFLLLIILTYKRRNQILDLKEKWLSESEDEIEVQKNTRIEFFKKEFKNLSMKELNSKLTKVNLTDEAKVTIIELLKLRSITEQIIDNTSDDKLLQLIFDNLSQKQPKDYTKEFETVMSWNKSQQAIYMIWSFEGEVNNGGYNQFYYNSSTQFYKYLPNALKYIGANKFADLTQQANDIFENENEKISKYQDGTIEGFSKSYNNNPLNDLDDKFYDLYQNENLQQIQVNYIRTHKQEFIDN